jgi:hypothetical protein
MDQAFAPNRWIKSSILKQEAEMPYRLRKISKKFNRKGLNLTLSTA